MTRSVNSPRRVASTRSPTRVLPRFTRVALGTMCLSSLANCFRRELGSRDVHTQTLASRSPRSVRAYSSSRDPGAACRAPSYSMSFRSSPSSSRSSVGIALPAASASEILRFFS